ncbi:unnamed protein product [Urochloa decumbens]|uniref:Myb/SANT-like DNA-binding domain-containing protein n=1 Tax=Urochloa decumbens TaxID=240449 RepID=A0ABC9HAX8_9POAL
MEGNILPLESMMQEEPYGSLDLHGNSMQTHAPNSGKQISSNSQMPRATETDEFPGFQFMEHANNDKHHNHHSKIGMSDVEVRDTSQDATDTPSGKDNKSCAWHRMKWTESMVKLLITAVSYTGDDHGADLGGGKRNFTMMQKKGKWKAISKVLGERDCHVSPQQCEDKFNDLNKRYKRLIDILGRGTACNVVETPALLDNMKHLSDKMKEEARKIINSKHLFFEEMCSYHNNNRVKLPEDHALQRSLLALRCKVGHDPRGGAIGYADEDDQSDDSEYEEEDEEQHPMHKNLRDPSMHKRVRHGDAPFVTPCRCHGKGRYGPQYVTLDINKAFLDGSDHSLLPKDLASQTLEIQKNLLQIEEKDLELKRRHLKWMKFRRRKEREIERMEMENKHMIMENKCLELELRRKELELELKLKGRENHA